jgi:CheY-like chemotaxis protein
MEHILVIDNDAATLRTVAIELQRFGFQIHLAGHADDALRLLSRRFHDYVFVDPATPGLDALLVCRLAREAPPPTADRAATTVVLLADPNGLATLLERALPAADACLRKPLAQAALLKLMGEREVARVAYADTARLTTTH